MLAIVSTPAKPPPATTKVSSGGRSARGAFGIRFFEMRDEAVTQLNGVA